VLRYDAVSGAFIDVVANGLNKPLGVTLGSDGSLYIADQFNNQILRESSAALNSSPPPAPTTFVSAGSGGLTRARKAVVGPDGKMYVASASTDQVLRYDGQTGAFIDVFATLPPNSSEGPMWLQFGSDGYLYTTQQTPNNSTTSRSIVRLNAATGAVVDSYVLGRDGWSFNLGPGNIVYDFMGPRTAPRWPAGTTPLPRGRSPSRRA
jgi:glucose/arabinose dehydrogenase